mmetsp:Transcript_49074/g.55557  ORF Transcript_49074/g.55557 Transcript_49074/m.55557 type:complete len:856 (+) Transcript_49074:58-2625(+)
MMDGVDEKTRETANTLLDVLWTSKKKTEVTTTTTLKNNNDKEKGISSRRMITNDITFGSPTTATITPTLRHGFGLNLHTKTKTPLPPAAAKPFQQQRLKKNSSDHSVLASSCSRSTNIISMKFLGFGIDNNVNSLNADATEAASKAVRDAMERSTLQFHSSHNHLLRVKIQLGVPAAVVLSSSDDTSMNQNDEQKPMEVNLSRLLSALPHVITTPVIEVVVGGLFILGDSSGSPSICTAIACIILESQYQPHESQQQQQQSEPQPSRSVTAPTLPPSSFLASEKLTTATEKLTHPIHNKQPTNQSTQLLSNTQQQQQQEDTPNLSQQQQLLSMNSNNNQSKLAWECSKMSSSPLVINGSRSTSAVSSTTTAVSSLIEPMSESPSLISEKPISLIAAATEAATTGNVHKKTKVSSTNITLPYYHQRNQQQQQENINHQRNDRHGNTDSIEMLAMISEREIDRRNSLGVGNVAWKDSETMTSPMSASLSSSTSFAASASRTSNDNNSSRSSSRSSSNNSSIDRGSTSDSVQMEIPGATTDLHKEGIQRQLEQSRQRQNQLAQQLELNSQLQSANHEQQKNLQLLEAQQNPSSHCQQKIQRLQQHSISRNDSSSPTARDQTTNANKTCTTRQIACVSYRDYSNEQPQPQERDCWALSTRTTSSPVFPLKLHETLTQIEKDGYDDIIGWHPHGRSFKIHKQKEFTDIILPRYFVMTKKSSFLRQLNLYSFNRFSGNSPDKGSYYHEKFLRGKKFLTRRMTRQKVNGNRIRSAGNPDEEPDLSSYCVCRDDDTCSSSTTSSNKNLSLPTSSSLLSSSSSSSSSPSQTVLQNVSSPMNTDLTVNAINESDTIGKSPYLRVL